MDSFIQTPVGPVPVVCGSPDIHDYLGRVLARLGFTRNSYTVSPGLYALGNPDSESPILVSANYKLSFDLLRFNLNGRNLWIVVLDTHGINVWCAAGKGTFSTDELTSRLASTRVAECVDHSTLIVPQLGATGVAAHEVKERTGFQVRYGPVRVTDVGEYLDQGCRAQSHMRQAGFPLLERIELIPVEFYLLGKALWWLVPALYLLSGFGPQIYSFELVQQRGLLAVSALFASIVSGAMCVPLLLPWLPGRSFAVKGAIAGLLCGFLLLLGQPSTLIENGARLIGVVSISSYLGLNFTGSTPFTSGSGVEWEMKRALPVQIFGTAVALAGWLIAPLVS